MTSKIILHTAAFAFMAATLAGCVVLPKDLPHEHAVDQAALGLDGPPVPKFAQGWWKVYGDQQLDRLIDQAFAHSPRLSEALARMRSAQAQTDFAIAGRSPSFALDIGETPQRFSDRDVIPPPYGGGFYWRGSALANMSWDIDFWGQQSALISQAGNQQRAATIDVESAKLALAGAIAQAYVDLERAYTLADIAARTEAQRQNILDITEKRLAAGLDTQLELRQSQGALPQARVEAEQAQTAELLAIHKIAALSGQGTKFYAKIVRPTAKLEAALELPSALPADLLAHRPDVLAALARVQAADAGRVAAKAAFYLSVELNAFAGWGSIHLSDLLDAQSRMYGLGPTVHLPIFDAQKLKSQYHGANAAIDLAVSEYNQTVLNAVQQVADQLSTLQGLKRELDDQKISLDAAEHAWRIAQERYRAGLVGYLSVLNAETQVLTAHRQRVDLVAAQAIARVTLLLSLGGSFNSATPSITQATPTSVALEARHV